MKHSSETDSIDIFEGQLADINKIIQKTLIQI